jgi:hypothetical protein
MRTRWSSKRRTSRTCIFSLVFSAAAAVWWLLATVPWDGFASLSPDPFWDRTWSKRDACLRHLGCPSDFPPRSSSPDDRKATAAQLEHVNSWLAEAIAGPPLECKRIRLGASASVGRDEGSWDVCTSSLAYPNIKGCEGVSIGVNYDARFDRAAALRGCRVHSFDPTTPCHPSMLARNVFFHPVGLGGREIDSQCGRVTTLEKLLSLTGGHAGRVMSFLKIDCEGCEWEAFQQIRQSAGGLKTLSTFDEVLLEVHFVEDWGFTMTRLLDLAEVLEGAGFVISKRTPNPRRRSVLLIHLLALMVQKYKY